MWQSWIRKLAALALVLTLGLSACGDAIGPQGSDARLTLLLTDAAASYLKEANVSIGAIHINPANGPPVQLTAEGGEFNLLELQNGVTAVLAEQVMEPGRFLWLRLVVNSAHVVLDDPFEFADGGNERSLTVPSGAQSGIQINLRYADDEHQAAGIEIAPGETILVVDFDVNQSFRIQGNPSTSAGIKGVSFTPLLRATVSDVAGSIAGTVTEPSEIEWPADPELSLTDLIVRATLTGSDEIEELQTPSGTATIDQNGDYKIWFLAPGSYEVAVEHPGFQDGPAILVATDPQLVDVPLERGADVTGVDFTLESVVAEADEE